MAAETVPRQALARAKVNLSLHVTGQRADGYHLLDSLVVFPALGDLLTVEPADGLSLSVSGPFAETLGADDGNLVLSAARWLASQGAVQPGVALHLRKNLPVASGIGGGSSDAAAALTLLSALWGLDLPSDRGLGLGADVPVCLQAPHAQHMSGIGEELRAVGSMPDFWLVLVNPLVGVPTGAVFSTMPSRTNPAMTTMPAAARNDLGAFVEWLAAQRNDLQTPAISLCPVIADCLASLATAPLCRMSGSGATCFAICATEADALALSADVRSARPDWWVAAGPVIA